MPDLQATVEHAIRCIGMHIIRADFRRLGEVSLHDAYDQLGVYVLWNAHGRVRPSYIGEGEVMKRFAAHLSAAWARRPLDGLIWINQEAVTDAVAKKECELVECALLALALHVDRDPIHNKSRGRPSAFQHVLGRFGERKVRINFSGYDPLFPPENPRMRGTKTLTILEDTTLDYDDWRSR